MAENSIPTAMQVANWMITVLHDKDELSRSNAVEEIQRRFGCQFLHTWPSGTISVHPKVQKIFHRLAPDQIVFEMSPYPRWRWRNNYDCPGVFQRFVRLSPFDVSDLR